MRTSDYRETEMGLNQRLGLAGLALAAGVAACAPASSELARPRLKEQLLFSRNSGGLAAVSSTSGRILFRVPGGVASPTWTHLFATGTTGDATLLQRVDPIRGTVVASTDLSGELEARVTSDDGLVALTPPGDEGSTLWLPAGKSRTTVVIADSRQERDRFRLRGNFEPEAFSVDNRELFMIEYIPALDPTRYRVRRLILDTGKVRPIGRLKQAAPGQMQGTGRTQVFSPDGDELYTLYTRQGPNYAHGDVAAEHRSGPVHAFVHVLNLRYGWAHCIDLPLPFGTGDAVDHAIAISPDGEDLYVVDPSTETLARIDPGKLRVVDVAEIDLRSPLSGAVTAEVVDDGTLFLASGAEVLSIEADSLTVNRRLTVPGPVTSLQLGSDGKTMIIGTDDRLQTVEISSGEVLASTDVEDAGGAIVHVGKR